MELKPSEWHRKPRRNPGPCVICGCPGRYLGEHRRVSQPGEEFPRFAKRRKVADGWALSAIDTTPTGAAWKPRIPTGPTKKTRDQITAAVRMRVFQGKTNSQIAMSLGVTPPMIADWRKLYRAIWDAAEQAAAASLVEVVRSQAGTDAIFEDPDLYIARAKAAEKWTQARGEDLFPRGDEPTLCSFYATFYVPVCLSEASDKTKESYESALKFWRLITGDPPLKEITTELLAKFRDVLAKRCGRRTHVRASPNTVRTKLRHIQSLIDKAGPPERRNRDAAGIIDKSPWIRPPKQDPQPVRVVEPETLNAVYSAAVGMNGPRIGNMKPAKWWRALIVLTYNTGLRRRTLFELQWDWIDWEKRIITIPRKSMKAGRLHIAPLNEATIQHLHAIRSDDRDSVLAWPYHPQHFDKLWRRLLKLAGVPPKEHFGLHMIRKTLATALWATNPAAAQLALSHADSVVTQNHYIDGTRIIAAAMDNLPQPAAFTQGIRRPA